jgi:hypothetical protein
MADRFDAAFDWLESRARAGGNRDAHPVGSGDDAYRRELTHFFRSLAENRSLPEWTKNMDFWVDGRSLSVGFLDDGGVIGRDCRESEDWVIVA